MNLLPCIARICKREEEAVQETLATSIAKLCPVLMGFTNDNEVKVSGGSFYQEKKNTTSVVLDICEPPF